jgi:hypothetical protein
MNGPSLCAIHQPNFFPRFSTLAKLYAADTWIVLDDVQFASRDYQHRARLGHLDDPNRQQWLSLSVRRLEGRASRLDQVYIVDQRMCQRRTALLIQQYYGLSPHWAGFQEALPLVLECIGQSDRLVDVTEASTRLLLQLVGWHGTVLHSSELSACTGRSERLADLTVAAGGTEYLCGTGGRRYLSTEPFAERGIAVKWFEAPTPCDTQFDLWSSAGQVSALWALMAFGPNAVRQKLSALFGSRPARYRMAPL